MSTNNHIVPNTESKTVAMSSIAYEILRVSYGSFTNPHKSIFEEITNMTNDYLKIFNALMDNKEITE